MEELGQTLRIQSETWGQVGTVPTEMMVASSHAGGIVLGAFEGKRLVGFAYALAGWEGNARIFWSHMLAVKPGLRNAGIGERLKWLQRKVALARGAKLIRWSFDPLEGRNAWLNLRKLGCLASEYIPNLYGPRASKLEGGLPTDRLIASWFLDSSRVRRRARLSRRLSMERGFSHQREFSSVPLVTETRRARGVFRCGRLRLGLRARTLRVEIPWDIQTIKQNHRTAAREWRMKIRQALSHYLRRGYVAADLWSGAVEGRRRSYYLLVRGSPASLQRS
jgi:predicted GNAT superfamily acetyltransferase